MNKYKKFLIIVIALCSLLPTLLNAQVDTAWVRRYNGPGNDADAAKAIAVDGAGNVYVTGGSIGIGFSDWATIKYNSTGVEQWVRRYDGSGNGYDEAYAMAIDNQNNVYVTGSSIGIGTYYDYLTIKYNSDGETLWIRRYDGSGNNEDRAYAMAIDNQNNVYVTGSSIGSGTNYDYLTIKYNSTGVEQWVRRYNGPGYDVDEAYAIAVDSQCNVYVSGGSIGSGTNYDYATIKYNTNGDTQWVRRYNGPANNYDRTYAIAIDNQNNVYVTGGSVGSGTNSDYLTIKYNSTGVEQWGRRYNGPGNDADATKAIAVDNQSNVYVTGSSYGSGTNYDYATIKYNTNGDTQWVRRYNGLGNGSDEGNAIAVDLSSNVYITGRSRGWGTDNDYATIKYNSLGVEQWVQRYNSPGNNLEDGASAIAVDNSANVYVTGYSRTSSTNRDYATIKYVPTQAIEENRYPLSADRIALKIYPNPARSFFTIRGPLSANRISIYDVSGKIVKEIASALPRNDNSMRISLNDIKNGVYFIRINDEMVKEKLVVTK